MGIFQEYTARFKTQVGEDSCSPFEWKFGGTDLRDVATEIVRYAKDESVEIAGYLRQAICSVESVCLNGRQLRFGSVVRNTPIERIGVEHSVEQRKGEDKVNERIFTESGITDTLAPTID